MKPKQILIVDDEADIRRLIRGILEDEGYSVLEAENAKQAQSQFEEQKPDLAILDIWLQGSDKDGLEILESFKLIDPHFPVLMISGHGNIETAVNAIKKGAYDFIEKPFKSDRLLLMISRGLESATLKKENSTLKNNYNLTQELFLSLSPKIQKFYSELKQSTKSSKAVFIEGDDAEIKSKVAQWLHEKSSKSDKIIALSKTELDNLDFKTLTIPTFSEAIAVDNKMYDAPLREARENFERHYLMTQIKRFKGNISQTAEYIGMERSALHRKLKSLDISPDGAQNDDKALNRHTG